MHVQHKDVFDLADSVLPALASCPWFATEVNIDTLARLFLTRMMLEEEEGAEGEGGEEEGAADRGEGGDEAIEHETGHGDSPMHSVMDKTRAKQWKELTDIVTHSRDPENDGPVFLDAWLYQAAKRLGKRLLGVEDAADHADLLREEEELGSGRSSEGVTIFQSLSYQRRMLDAYKAGDVALLEELMRDMLPPDRFHRMLTRRNRIMVESIESYIAQTPTFIAVGSGHLGGEYGIISLMRDRGYVVTPVRVTRSGRPPAVTIPTDPLPWYTLVDTGAAFSIDLPIEPVASKLDTVDGNTTFVRLWMAADGGGGLFYTLYCVDLPTHYPSLELGAMLEDVATDWGSSFGARTVSTADVRHGTLAGSESMMVGSDGAAYRMRVFMRGRRYYVLMVAGDERLLRREDAERFFASFTIRPFVPHSWRTELIASEGVRIDLPTVPDIGEELIENIPNTTVTTAVSRDLNSGRTYTLQVYRYSRYFSARSWSEYWQSIVSDWTDVRHSVTDSAIVVDGFPGRDIVVVDKGSGIVTRVRSVVVGGRLIEIFGTEGAVGEGTSELNRFISSLRLEGTSAEGDIFQPHADIILTDVMSDSADVRGMALAEIGTYPWSDNDLPLLYSAIERNYPMDDSLSTGYLSTRARLIGALRHRNDSTTLAFLRGLFGRLPGDPFARSAIATTLAMTGTFESVSILVDLLDSDREHLPGFTFYYVHDSLAALGPLVPRLVKLAERPQHRLPILQLLEQGLDSGAIAATSLRGTALAELCRRSIEEGEGFVQDTEFDTTAVVDRTEWTATAVRVLGWLTPTDENVRIAKELLRSDTSWKAMSALLALIRMTGTAPRESLERLASDSSLVIWFYSELRGMGKLELFPPFLRKQAYLAMGELIQWVLYDKGTEPTAIRYVTQREVDLDTGRGRVFLFKFRLAEGGEWLTGLSGPQPINSSELEIGGHRTTSRYRPLGDIPIDAHIEELLQQ